MYFLEGPSIVIFFSFCEATLCHPGWPRMCYVDNVGLKFPEICLPLALLPRYRSCFLFEMVLKVCDPLEKNQWAVFQVQRSQVCTRLFSSADSTDHGLGQLQREGVHSSGPRSGGSLCCRPSCWLSLETSKRETRGQGWEAKVVTWTNQVNDE